MSPKVSYIVVAVVAAVAGAAIGVGIVLGTRPACDDANEESVAVDRMRPAYHYTPLYGWVNDPNGLVYHDGEWHMFYQHDYETTLHGYMSWGHAVSGDLVHWEELPVAISYDDKEQIFSGSVVVDTNCTSGLCASPGQPVLIAAYTSFAQQPDPASAGGDRHFQSQHIASSTDRGRTWTKFDGNPVLDKHLYEFRDPKVSRHGDHWLMLVQKSDEHVLQMYKSADLKSWGDAVSNFGPVGHQSGVWECPDMFPLAVDDNPANIKWVLIVNINPGNRFDGYGSAAQFFIGNFDGTAFSVDDDFDVSDNWLDWGTDNYATITWNNAPDGQIYAIGWMSNWNYTHLAPGGTWRNTFTTPRLLKVKTVDGVVRLLQNPVPQLADLRHDGVQESNVAVKDGDYDMGGSLRGRAVDIEVDITNTNAKEFGVRVYAGRNQETLIGYDVARGELFVDRVRSGTVSFDARFPARHSVKLPLGGADRADSSLKLRIMVDHGSVEVFANDGEVAVTDVIFPDPSKDAIAFYARGGSIVLNSYGVWQMRTTHGRL